MRILCLIILLLASIFSYSREVSNINAHKRGRDIVITYDLDVTAYASDLKIIIDGKSARRIPSEYLSGDIGKKVEKGRERKIVYRFLDDYQDSIKECRVRFIIKLRETSNFVMLNFGFNFSPQFSGGLMYGFCVGRLGWYLKARTGFAFAKADYSSLDEGKIKVGGELITPFYTGKIQRPLLVVNTGMIVKMVGPLYGYIGVGYGERSLLWQMSGNKWVKNLNNSISGVSSEIGLLFKFGKFSMSIGVNDINFKYVDMEAALGIAL